MKKQVTGASAEITFRYISLDTAIKRTRRHLAKSGATIIKSKPGTAAWRELGDFAVKDASGEVLMKSVNLTSLMQAAEILADDERIELPNKPDWRWYVARHVVAHQDGKTHRRNEPLTKLFFSETQALRAAEAFDGIDEIVVVGFNQKGGTQNADH